ncbi:MAG: LysM peptidoglycan-binding domain-containing protein, partial [Tissierellia bacterium]|nr:LysM peptidoglycan-binding domain-containing protein [Tissierellia bacterium]
ISIYDEIEKQALAMADMMSNGIIRQFPNKFLN